MITETGQVVAIEEDGLWVETVSQSTCSTCVARNGCGHNLLSKIMQGNNKIKANFTDNQNDKPWVIGERVQIGIDERAFVLLALTVYMIPLMVMLLFAVFAVWLGLADFLVALLAFAGLIFAGAVIKGNLFSLSKLYNSGSLRVVVLTNGAIKGIC